MANRYPIIVDTTNGNQFRELPEGDNLLLTGSSLVNVLNITAIGTIESQRLVINNQEFTGSYNDLEDLPSIPSSILDLNILDGTAGQVLTTNGAGLISFQNIPLQNPVVGGDLEGTAATAQLKANVVGVRELDVADGTIGQVLATDGAGNLQFITVSGGTGGTGGASSFLELSGTIGLTQIEDNFLTPEKLKTDGDTPGPHQYLTVNTETGFFEYLDLPTESIDYGDILNTPTIPATLTDLGVTDGSEGDVLVTDGAGNFTFNTLTNVEQIEFSGTTITTVNNNSNIALDPKGNGYVSVQGTNALIIPVGTTIQRTPTIQGGIRFNTELNEFEGYNGANWGSLGGIKDADSDTYLTTESSAGADEDTFTFYTGGQQSATLNSTLFNLAQGVNVKINSTQTALDFDTGALSVDGGVSIRGNLLVSGSIDVDQTFDTSAAVEVSVLTDTQTNIVTVPSADMAYFKANQKVRLFRASPIEIVNGVPTNPEEQLVANLSLSVTPIGFLEAQPGDSVSFSYRIAQMDLETGKISSATVSADVAIRQSEQNLFNNNRNMQVTVSRQSAAHAILVYRKVGSEVNHKLIKVLGPKDLQASLSNIQWTDYYDFDLVDWSKKDAVNAFTTASGVIHAPITAPNSNEFGWHDTYIDSVDLDNNQLSLGDSFFASSASTIIVIDDTESLQAKIDQAKSQNRNSLELENRTYYVKQLVVPSNFTLYGQGDQTRLVKTPWSTNYSTGSNAMITVDRTTYGTNQNNISVKNLRIDGNAQNQYLTSDVAIPYNNWAVYIFGNDILFENLEIENIIGGGIYSFDSSTTTDLTILNCEVTNGTLSYVYEEYGPVYADQSRNIKFAHNTFRNFPGPVSISAVQKGIVSPNVVDNCGSGIFAYGASKIILTPNVLLGPAGEFIQNPDVLNSEYDQVNIQIEQDVDYNSTQYVYQENGDFFDFTANQGRLTAFINELIKTDNVEEITTDYSETLTGDPYIEFTNPGDATGVFAFRIVKTKVNDLLSRANFATLRSQNANSQGLVYRIVATEYVARANIVGEGTQEPGGAFTVAVEDLTGLPIGTVIRLQNHGTTPPNASQDGTIVSINTVNKTIGIDFGDAFGDITQVAVGARGQVLVQNNFVVVKGKIN
jgi:hypothetical protein